MACSPPQLLLLHFDKPAVAPIENSWWFVSQPLGLFLALGGFGFLVSRIALDPVVDKPKREGFRQSSVPDKVGDKGPTGSSGNSIMGCRIPRGVLFQGYVAITLTLNPVPT
jgi:hypothetical protein